MGERPSTVVAKGLLGDGDAESGLVLLSYCPAEHK